MRVASYSPVVVVLLAVMVSNGFAAQVACHLVGGHTMHVDEPLALVDPVTGSISAFTFRPKLFEIKSMGATIVTKNVRTGQMATFHLTVDPTPPLPAADADATFTSTVALSDMISRVCRSGGSGPEPRGGDVVNATINTDVFYGLVGGGVDCNNHKQVMRGFMCP